MVFRQYYRDPTERPGLTAALDYLRPGDALVVWKLDRLGRSVKDVLTIADDLHERGIGVRILTGKLAGSYSPTGEGKFFHDHGRLRRAGARHHPRADHGRPGPLLAPRDAAAAVPP